MVENPIYHVDQTCVCMIIIFLPILMVTISIDY